MNRVLLLLLFAVLVITPSANSANQIIWQIGVADDSGAEFALAPSDYKRFLEKDFGWEDRDLSAQHPEVVKRLLNLAEKIKDDIGDLDQKGKNQREAGWVDKPMPRLLGKQL